AGVQASAWHEVKRGGGRVWSRMRRPGERLGGLLANYALMQSEFVASPAGSSLRSSLATRNLVPFGRSLNSSRETQPNWRRDSPPLQCGPASALRPPRHKGVHRAA